jgi:hypothetical protein
LRFQWAHALGLAFVIWLVMTLLVLPMLLAYAAEVSQARHAVSAGTQAARLLLLG